MPCLALPRRPVWLAASRRAIRRPFVPCCPQQTTAPEPCRGCHLPPRVILSSRRRRRICFVDGCEEKQIPRCARNDRRGARNDRRRRFVPWCPQQPAAPKPCRGCHLPPPVILSRRRRRRICFAAGGKEKQIPRCARNDRQGARNDGKRPGLPRTGKPNRKSQRQSRSGWPILNLRMADAEAPDGRF